MTSMFVPLRTVIVRFGVVKAISVQAVEFPVPPPHPANEITGSFTGFEK